MNRGFGSDNHSGVHPKIWQALAEANTGHAPSYGTDEWTIAATAEFKKHFGAATEVFFVFNGTAANCLSLRASMRSYQAVFCSDVSHLHVDECAAPEFFSGGKLWVLPSVHGKINLAELQKNFIRRGDQHFAQGSVVSLTQPTELGTVYSLSEIRNIVDWAHAQKLLVHVDGARLANACVFLNKTFAQITRELGVDVVSFGGTKNGLLMGEAVLFLNPELAKDFSYIRKQSAQLPSKSRFLAAGFTAYLQNNLWREIALHSHQMAQALAEAVRDLPGVQITQPVESNAVFARIPKAWVAPLRKEKFFYVWDENTFECRWMTSWDTDATDIESFQNKIKGLSREIPAAALS